MVRWRRPSWLKGDGGDGKVDTRGEPDDERARFHEVADDGFVESLFESPPEGASVLFLHDPWCPVSRRAYSEVARVDADVHIVDVSSLRRMSRLIEERTGVGHQSPQLFVLRAGRTEWHASHGGVRAEAVAAALRDARP